MSNRPFSLFLSLGALLSASGSVAAEPVVDGVYVETRISRLPSGRPFSGPETQLRGDHALLGWEIRRGTWNGVKLDGLVVALFVDCSGRLRRPGEGLVPGRLEKIVRSEGIVRSVLYIDRRADEKQEKALIDLVGELSPRYARTLIKVHRLDLSLREEKGILRWKVGKRLDLKLQAAEEHGDGCHAICGGEELEAPCLSRHTRARCAQTLSSDHRFPNLEFRWKDLERRATLVGRFSL